MSYRTKNTPAQITIPNYREPISGVVATAMALGALVMYKNDGAPQDDRVLVACEAGRPAMLELQVLSDANWQAHNKLDPQWSLELRKPVPVGSTVTARFAHEAEFEGTAYFDTLDGNSTPGTPLYVTGGKFKTAVLGTHEVVARLGRKLTPFLSTSFRWSVEFVG
jgi:hypothetical protein